MQTLMLCVVFALAQPDKPSPPTVSVEQALATALKNHPDIKVAEAKLQLVKVELDQAKVHAIQEVTAAELKVQTAKQGMIAAEDTLQRHGKLREKANISDEEFRASQTALAHARGVVLAAQQNLDAAKAQPGLKVIEARLALAAAELEQARLQVTKTVTVSHATVQSYRSSVEEMNKLVDSIKKSGAAQLELMRYLIELAQLKGRLDTSEAELAAAIGRGAKAESDSSVELVAVNRLKYLRFNEVKAVALSGTVADKLRGLLDKPIKLDLQAAPFSELMPAFLKQAGLDGITVRYPTWATKQLRTPWPSTGPYTGEKSLTAWFELMLDEFNATRGEGMNELGFAPPYVVVVREYGLLVVPKATAPPDAITLTEFAKVVKAEKAAENEKKVEPKR